MKEVNWKIAIGLVIVGYLIFLAYEATQAENAVGDAAGSVGGELEKIWNGLSGSMGNLTDAASELSEIYDV